MAIFWPASVAVPRWRPYRMWVRRSSSSIQSTRWAVLTEHPAISNNTERMFRDDFGVARSDPLRGWHVGFSIGRRLPRPRKCKQFPNGAWAST